jgi:hypothetical protein
MSDLIIIETIQQEKIETDKKKEAAIATTHIVTLSRSESIVRKWANSHNIVITLSDIKELLAQLDSLQDNKAA